jgi:hypothetical protein
MNGTEMDGMYVPHISLGRLSPGTFVDDYHGEMHATPVLTTVIQ